MTPKEKAVELVEKYGIWCWNDGVCDYELAKQCALIAVNEIRDAIIEINEYDYQSLENYWYRVKQEIEKL
jgi:hypothetical protein